MERHFVMLTFDLEEFDIPEEYGQKISVSEQMGITLQGMDNLMKVLDAYNISVTFFTTGNFAKNNTELIKNLSEKHEIASHALYHSPVHQFVNTDIPESKSILESITGKKVTGFRMPRLKPFDITKLTEYGFQYDSSINPTYLPGRYNLLHKNPTPHIENNIIELPCSTTPLIRFPLFWLSFKNLPVSVYSALCRRTLKKRKNLMLYFHPWEFADIGGYNLPGYVKNPNGEMLTKKLKILIKNLLNEGGEFVTSAEYCKYLVDNSLL